MEQTGNGQTTKQPNEQAIKAFADKVRAMEAEIAKEMVGQREVVRQVLIAVLAGGNVLLEGVPGLGKTRLVRTLSKVLALSFSRIQFTPDLMPADVVGTTIFLRDETGGRFQFQQGPIFAHLVLADEINRATPKTQSAMLEAMQEHSVTVGDTTRQLPQPFFVMATQNPLEQEGTYPLPEAQLDRFMIKTLVPFPNMDDLRGIVEMTTSAEGEAVVRQIADAETLLSMREVAKQVPVARSVSDFALALVLRTHPDQPDSPAVTKQYVRYGASPRAAQALINGARIRALMEGRFNVAFEDIRSLALPVLRHRVFLNFEAMSQSKSVEDVILEIMDSIHD